MEKTAGESDWISKIQKRAQLFEAWRAELPRLKELAAKCLYIRVGGGSYRLISVAPGNPCGHLTRRGKGTVIGYSASMLMAIKNAELAEIAETKKPGIEKKEHKMQAALIQHALMNDLNLHGLVDGFSDVFDELLFVTDELSAGNIRADIIALGGMQGKYFPVFIELKAVRALGDLITQLTEAKKAMMIAGDSFLQLLANATGKPKSDISFDGAQSLIIWRNSPSGNEREKVADARSARYLIAAYDDTSGHVRRDLGNE